MKGLRLTLIAGLLLTLHSPLFADSPGREVDNQRVDASGFGEIFMAPRLLFLRVEGIAGDGNTTILLERVDTGDHLEIPVDRWRPSTDATWVVPREWVGQPVRVVSQSESSRTTSLRLVRSPTAGVGDLLLRQAPSLLLPLIVIACIAIVLSPGLAFLVTFVRPGAIPAYFRLPLVFLVTAATGYLHFWIYFLDHRIGFASSIAFVSASLITLVIARHRATEQLLDRQFVIPLLLLLFVSTCYLGVLFVAGGGQSVDSVAPTRFFLARPLDNLIPEYFADRLYQGGDPRITGPEWHSSDRPPLQAGIVLLARPLCDALGVDPGIQYQVIGTVLQCMWIPVLWATCAMLELSMRRTAITFAFLIFSGFFLYNGVYVWPKLLAGSLMVFAMLLVLQRDAGRGMFGAAGLSAALALLAHSGVAFTLIGAATVFLAARIVRPVRQMQGLALGGLVAILLLAPWVAYQKVYDPPGDRLLKIHLAGVQAVDNERPATEAIRESWSRLTVSDFLTRKAHSFRTLLGLDSIMSSAVFAEDSRLTRQTVNDPMLMWRSREQQHVGTSLGLLNLGWLALAALLLSRDGKRESRTRILLILVATGLCGLSTSALVFFSGGNTVTTHLSYGDILLLHSCLAIALSRFPRVVIVPLFAIHLTVFSWVWLATSPPVPIFSLPYASNFASMMVAILSAALIAFILASLGRFVPAVDVE